jgi:putative redox protein
MSELISIEASLGELNYRTNMTNGRQTVYCDEPQDKGGQDTAPAPRELLCMSLAACTAITLRMYAGRKNWNPGNIDVQVTLSEDENGNQIFARTITWQHALDDATRDRLLIVADKCPVHKLLSAGNTIITKMG